MFERYTERARRAIFFARYEASNYGNPCIESEHLLLGLLREDRALGKWFPARIDIREIRAEIEKRITRRECIPTNVEVPLAAECKKILTLAAESAERLGHRRVENEHLLIGILRVESSMAAQILFARGVELGPLQERLTAASPTYESVPTTTAFVALNNFLAGLKWLNSEELIPFFAKNAVFIDASGKRWNREEMSKEFEMLFACYAKKNASYVVEETLADTSALFVANVLWKNAFLVSEQRIWMHRMTVVLSAEEGEWRIVSAQVTPVQIS